MAMRSQCVDLSQDQLAVWLSLPHGRDKRISRSQLAMHTGFSDRALRLLIADMRAAGYPIMSTSHLDGYWIPTQSEMERDSEIFLKELSSRIENIGRSAAWAKNAQRRLKGRRAY